MQHRYLQYPNVCKSVSVLQCHLSVARPTQYTLLHCVYSSTQPSRHLTKPSPSRPSFRSPPRRPLLTLPEASPQRRHRPSATPAAAAAAAGEEALTVICPLLPARWDGDGGGELKGLRRRCSRRQGAPGDPLRPRAFSRQSRCLGPRRKEPRRPGLSRAEPSLTADKGDSENTGQKLNGTVRRTAKLGATGDRHRLPTHTGGVSIKQRCSTAPCAVCLSSVVTLRPPAAGGGGGRWAAGGGRRVTAFSGEQPQSVPGGGTLGSSWRRQWLLPRECGVEGTAGAAAVCP